MKYAHAIHVSNISIATREDDDFIYYISHHGSEKVCKKTHKHTKIRKNAAIISSQELNIIIYFDDWRPYERGKI